MLRSFVLSAVLLSIAIATPLFGKEAPPKPADPAADINKPQPGARRIAFSTNQGTWTSLDVSPDGQTIVFDLLGDLYTVPISGGTAQRVTSGPAWDAFPRYSPDGKEIAFTSDRSGIDNLWILDAAGTPSAKPRAVTEEKDAYVRAADWTPDGQFLVARREDGKLAGIPPVEMFVYSRHGGSGVKLTNSDDTHNASGAVASADGRFFYFARRQRPFNYIPNLQDGLFQIARHDRVTGEVAQLTGGVGGAVRPALSPDGRLLSYVSRRDGETVLVLRELAIGSERILVRGLGKDEMEGFGAGDLFPGYSFTPDGAAIVLSDRGRLARFGRSHRRARRDSVHRGGGTVGRSARRLAERRRRRRPRAQGLAPARDDAGRRRHRLRGAGPALAPEGRGRQGGGRPGTSHQRRYRSQGLAGARVQPDDFCGRRLGGVRLVERSRTGARLEDPCRGRRSDPPDEGRGALRQPGMVTLGRQAARPARLRPRVARPPAGGRRELRGARSRRRRGLGIACGNALRRDDRGRGRPDLPPVRLVH